MEFLENDFKSLRSIHPRTEEVFGTDWRDRRLKYIYLTYNGGESSGTLEVTNPADNSEAEFQPDDKQENVINKDLEGRIVSLMRWN